MPKSDKHGPEFSRDREIKVLLEDLRGEFRVFGEGLQDVRKKLHEGLQGVQKEFQNVHGRLDRMESSLSRFFTTLSNHESRIVILEKTGR